MIIMLYIENDVVVNSHDVIRIMHCTLYIESAQPAAILTCEWTSYV